MKKRLIILVGLLLCLLAFNFFSRSEPAPQPANPPISVQVTQSGNNSTTEPEKPETPENPGQTDSDGDVKPDNPDTGNTTIVETPSEPEQDLIDYDGVYDSKDEVALYIYTYGELPSNYITKKEAKALGWSGGSLEDYAPGKCIGGDYFGNYEGILPEDHEYHECDIGTLGKKSRGSKRIIYSEDGLIYYTKDHYESFTLLYGEE